MNGCVRDGRRRYAAVVAVGIWLSGLQAGRVAGAEPELQRFTFRQVHMGMPFDLILYAADEAAANRAAEAAYAKIAELDRVFSDYDPKSESSLISDGAGSGKAVQIGADMRTVLERSQTLWKESKGAFDVTVGPAVRLWRRSRRQKALPEPEKLRQALDAVGFDHVEFDAEAGTIRLLRPKMRLDFGGIAAGYAVDQAQKVLREQGIARALIDASGDIGVSDPPPGKKGWTIGIVPLGGRQNPPSRYILLRNQAVTTSGDAFQHVSINGTRYSHIVDPRTGLGLTTRQSATVIASDCTAADSLATALCVLGPEKGQKLIEPMNDVAAIFVQDSERGPIVTESPRFVQFAAPGAENP